MEVESGEHLELESMENLEGMVDFCVKRKKIHLKVGFVSTLIPDFILDFLVIFLDFLVNFWVSSSRGNISPGSRICVQKLVTHLYLQLPN